VVDSIFDSGLRFLCFVWFGLVCFFETGSHHAAQAGLELEILPGAGITYLCHHTQLCPRFFKR
jgi:hypothetical protein